jgi:hypothetical protein
MFVKMWATSAMRIFKDAQESRDYIFIILTIDGIDV